MFLPGHAVPAGFVHEEEIDSAGNWLPVPGGAALQVVLAACASGRINPQMWEQLSRELWFRLQQDPRMSTSVFNPQRSVRLKRRGKKIKGKKKRFYRSFCALGELSPSL